MIICLDPGHGGSNHGARSRDLAVLEPQWVLDLAIRAAGHLSRGPLVQPLLTREGDYDLTHAERAGFAARVGAAAVVSLHLNWYDLDPLRRGPEIYVWPGDKAGRALGSHVLSALPTLTDWRIRYANARHEGRVACPGAYELVGAYHEAGLPCALIEWGFLSCAADVAWLRAEKTIDVVAQALAKGCEAWAQSANTPSEMDHG